MKLVLPAALAVLALAGGAAAAHAQPGGPAVAVREVGQPNFLGFVPNRLDARGVSRPTAVAIDRSRTPNGIWVADAQNNRVLGWRDLASARGGVPADVILGQPAATTNGCNQGGRSALSLCFVRSFRYDFAEHPGVAADAEGNVWVSDRGNLRVLGYRRPFDEDARADVVVGQDSFDTVIPTYADSPARRFLSPNALATDAEGNLYIADGSRVVEVDRPFTGDAGFDRVFGLGSLADLPADYDLQAPQPDRLPRPQGLGVDGQGRLFVAEGRFDRVQAWSSPLTRQGAADLVIAQSGADCVARDFCRNHKALAVSAEGGLWVLGLSEEAVLGYRAPLSAGDTPERVLPLLRPLADGFPIVPDDARPTLMDGGMAFDGAGGLWLTDWNRVLGYTRPWDGGVVADRLLGQVRADQVTANLTDGGGLYEPRAVALDESASPAHLYVVDARNHRVLGWSDAESFRNGQPADLVLGQPDRWSSRCNSGGRSLRSLCLEGFGEQGIAVDHRGTVWVADGGNARVLGYRRPFDEDTVADFLLGQPGPGSDRCGQGRRRLCRPGGVAVDGDGNVFVADLARNLIVEYDDPLRRGAGVDRVLGEQRRQGICSEPATCFSVQEIHGGVFALGGVLAIDDRGRLLVGNDGHVWVFERPLGRWASARSLIEVGPLLEVSFEGPHGLGVDEAGRIYVSANRVVYAFSRGGGGPLGTVGEPCRVGDSTGLPEGVGPQSLCDPTGLALSRHGELFVADAGMHRVVAFAPP